MASLTPLMFKRCKPAPNAPKWVTFNVWGEDADEAEQRLAGAERSLVDRPSPNALGNEAQALRQSDAAASAETEPPPGLLMSIAMRLDHAIGLPGYYDHEGPGAHARHLQMALADARRAWEEVTGNGFYRAEKEAGYAAMASAAAVPQQHSEPHGAKT